MDRQIEKEKRIIPRRWQLVVVALLSLLLLAVLLPTLDFHSQRVDRDTLQLGIVTRGKLDIKVSANGRLLPRHVQWIASRVEARVAAIERRAGDKVVPGDVIVRLSNPALLAAADEAQSALEGAEAQLLSYRVELENELLQQKSVSVQAKFAWQSAQLKLEAETKLRQSSEIISDIDYRRTQLDVEQLAARHQIEQQRHQKRQHNMAAQLGAKQALVRQFSKARDRAQDEADALEVVATMAGVLQQMDLKVGQRLQSGSEIARLARQDELYAELKVQARQAARIVAGQRAVIDTRSGTVVGVVSRIDPAVNAGTVLVDVELTAALPAAARPQLAVEGTVYIEQLDDVLYVGKPRYSQVDSDITVYRLQAGGDYAQRVQVHTGSASVNKIQILSGLAVGDQIILSDSSDWQQHESILLN